MTSYSRADRTRALKLMRVWRDPNGMALPLSIRPKTAELLASTLDVDLVFKPVGDGWVPLAKVALAVAYKLNVQDRFKRLRRSEES